MAVKQLLPVLLLLCALLDVSVQQEMYLPRAFNEIDRSNYFAEFLKAETEKLTNLNKELETLSKACEVKLNTTYDECSTCTKTKCSSPPNMNKPNVLNSALAAISNPSKLIGPPLQAVGNLAGKVPGGASDILKAGLEAAVGVLSEDQKKELSNVITSISNTFKNIGKSSGILNLAKASIAGTVSTGKTIAGGAETASKKVSDGVKTAVDKVGDVAKDAWDATKKIFGGRRRRSVTAQEQACYDKCPICAGIILPKTNDKINAVCGSALINTNNSVVETAQFLVKFVKSMEEYPGSYITLEFPYSGMNFATKRATKIRITGILDKIKFDYISILEVPLQAAKTPAEKLLVRNVFAEFLTQFRTEIKKKYALPA